MTIILDSSLLYALGMGVLLMPVFAVVYVFLSMAWEFVTLVVADMWRNR